MIWLTAFMMLAFYGLAVCTIGGMVTGGIGVGLALATAVLEITVGIIIARVMCRVAR